MSRRTKLLFTAVFLVLLAIPVAYIIFTWSPVNPLRFRVVPLRKPSIIFNDYASQASVRVENTSAAAIYLEYTTFHEPQKVAWIVEGLGSISREGQTTAGKPGSPEALMIPPGDTIEVLAMVANDHADDARAGRLRATYTFKSTAKHHATNICVWLYNFMPDRFSPYVPIPESDSSETRLEAMTE